MHAYEAATATVKSTKAIKQRSYETNRQADGRERTHIQRIHSTCIVVASMHTHMEQSEKERKKKEFVSSKRGRAYPVRITIPD